MSAGGLNRNGAAAHKTSANEQTGEGSEFTERRNHPSDYSRSFQARGKYIAA